MTAENPLLDCSGLPRFDTVQAAHVAPAVDALLAQAQSALDQVTQADFPAEWLAVSAVLDVATERLSRAWGMVSHLHAVKDSPALREAYAQQLPKVTEFWTRLGSDERLYAKYKAMPTSALNDEQRRAHALALRNFVLSGAELSGEDKARFAQIQERMASLSQQFSEHVLDATDGWGLLVGREQLDGVPEDILAATAQAAQDKGLQGHWLTLKMPVYLPIMQCATSSALREQLYRAYVTRASDLSPLPQRAELDNGPIMAELLQLRHEEAQLLGFDNAAQASLATKMAPSPQAVVEFLQELAQRARPHAEQDVAAMRAFAREHLGLNDPQPWDWTFIAERLKEHRYAFSEQEVKAYFTAPKVLNGLFAIVESLLEFRIVGDVAPTWDDTVRFFRLERQGQLVGQFYLDPGARAGKRGGAWMDDVRARWLRPDTQELQTPVAHLVCNFAQGVNGQPPLLTHDDVITLFHECGHGLHHLLTQVNERDVSGISGVEWDAVELPSQFMENFCWEWSVIQGMTAHVQTGEPLPRELFDKMLAAKNFQSGLQTLRQVEFAWFDMAIHLDAQAAAQDVMAVMNRVREQVAVIETAPFNRMPHSFSHVFAGGYAAGYYSYKWAEVLSADAYAAFEESQSSSGQHSIETGRRYRTCILEAGGARPAMDSFKAFRGREPSLDALMRHSGMASPAQ